MLKHRGLSSRPPPDTDARRNWRNKLTGKATSVLDVRELRPIELRPAKRNQHQLRAAHGDNVHGLQRDRSGWPLVIHRNDIGLRQAGHEQERPLGGIIADIGLLLGGNGIVSEVDWDTLVWGPPDRIVALENRPVC